MTAEFFALKGMFLAHIGRYWNWKSQFGWKMLTADITTVCFSLVITIRVFFCLVCTLDVGQNCAKKEISSHTTGSQWIEVNFNICCIGYFADLKMRIRLFHKQYRCTTRWLKPGHYGAITWIIYLLEKGNRLLLVIAYLPQWPMFIVCRKWCNDVFLVAGICS